MAKKQTKLEKDIAALEIAEDIKAVLLGILKEARSNEAPREVADPRAEKPENVKFELKKDVGWVAK